MTARAVWTLLLLPLLLSAAFTLALVLACLVPGASIERNARASARPLLERGGYPRAFGIDSKAFQLDFRTESTMLGIAYAVDSRRPLESAMADSMPISSLDLQRGLRMGRLGSDRIVEVEAYARYWHGYLVYLRPLLAVMDLRWILMLSGLALAALTVLVIGSLHRRGIGIGVPLVLSMLLTNVLAAAQTLVMSQTYVIGMAFALWAARTSRRSEREYLWVFALNGALTVFFDFLTAPVMTWGLPAVVLACVLFSEGHLGGLRRGLRFVIVTGTAWGYAYVATWACKWLLGQWVLGRNVVADGMARLQLEGGTQGTNVSQMLDKLVGFPVPGRINAPLVDVAALLEFDNHRRLLLNVAVWLVLVGVTALLLVWFRRPRLDRSFVCVLGVIALAPYVWYAGSAQHAMRHYWFTYRGQLVTILAVACACSYAIDWGALRRLRRPAASDAR